MVESRIEWWERSRREIAASPVAYAALLGFTFVLLMAPQASYPVLEHFHIAAVAVALAIGALLARRLAHGATLVTIPRGTGLALVLGAWATATAPLSYWPGGSIQLFVDLFAKSLVVFWLIPQIVDSTERLRRLVTWLSLLALPLAVAAVRNFVSGSFLDGSPDVQRIAGYDAPLTANPNDLALTLNLLIPLTYALRTVTRRSLVRLALGALLLLEVVGVILTYSRAGFITLATVWIVHALRTLRGFKRVAVAVGAAAAVFALAVIPSTYVQHLGTAVNMAADPTGSAQERWRDALAAVEVVADHPALGVGLGMNVLAVTEQTGGWRSVHNVYLQYAADLGVPGLVLFLVLLVRCVRDARSAHKRRPRNDQERDLGKLALGIELSLWAFAVAALFHPAGYHFYFYYLGGLALAARAIYARRVSS